jgi:Phage minor capsid protein 2.
MLRSNDSRANAIKELAMKYDIELTILVFEYAMREKQSIHDEQYINFYARDRLKDWRKERTYLVDKYIKQSYNDGMRGFDEDFSGTLRIPDMRRSTQMLLNETIKPFNVGDNLILRNINDVFRKITAEKTMYFTEGIDTQRQNTQRILNAFVDRGITYFVDRANRQWDIVSYSEMASRTIFMRANVAGFIETAYENGQNHVIVSAHANSCPLCQVWENRILSLQADGKYPSLDEAMAGGLFHPNCGHSLAVYIEGITKQEGGFPYGHDNDDGYKTTQQQRYYERMVRKWKKRELVALDPNTKKKAKQQVRLYQNRINSLIKDYTNRTGLALQRKYYRERIEGSSRL